MLQMAQQQGWDDLVRTVNAILQGRRDEALLNGLDEEDTVIIRSILLGIQNPASLPDPNQGADPAMAAPGLAHKIHAASRGDAQALQAAAYMAEQMINTQGDMRLLGGQIKRLLDGERNPDVLCKGMGPSGQQLVLNILEELNMLAEQ
jgi:streptomycin 6-kinase